LRRIGRELQALAIGLLELPEANLGPFRASGGWGYDAPPFLFFSPYSP
jgi:hypothetical protein